MKRLQRLRQTRHAKFLLSRIEIVFTSQHLLTFLQIDVAVNAPEAGTIKEFLAQEEDTVTVGQDLVRLEPGGAPEGGKEEKASSEPKEPASKEQPTSSEPKEESKPISEESKPVPKKETPPPPPPKKQEQPKKTEASSSSPSAGNREEKRVRFLIPRRLTRLEKRGLCPACGF